MFIPQRMQNQISRYHRAKIFADSANYIKIIVPLMSHGIAYDQLLQIKSAEEKDKISKKIERIIQIYPFADVDIILGARQVV